MILKNGYLKLFFFAYKLKITWARMDGERMPQS